MSDLKGLSVRFPLPFLEKKHPLPKLSEITNLASTEVAKAFFFFLVCVEWDDLEAIQVPELTIWDRSLRSWCVSGARWRRCVERLGVRSPKRPEVPYAVLNLQNVSLMDVELCRFTSQPCMR